MIAFVKYRIYNFAVNVILRGKTYSLDIFPDTLSFMHLIGTTWIFYALNLYWLQMIILKIGTKIEKQKDDAVMDYNNNP